MGYKYPTDPYVAMLKRSEHKAFGYGFLALFLLVIALLVAGISSDGAGQFAPMVQQVRYTVGMIILYGSGLAILATIWFSGLYVYFFKSPERFEH